MGRGCGGDDVSHRGGQQSDLQCRSCKGASHSSTCRSLRFENWKWVGGSWNGGGRFPFGCPHWGWMPPLRGQHKTPSLVPMKIRCEAEEAVCLWPGLFKWCLEGMDSATNGEASNGAVSENPRGEQSCVAGLSHLLASHAVEGSRRDLLGGGARHFHPRQTGRRWSTRSVQVSPLQRGSTDRRGRRRSACMRRSRPAPRSRAPSKSPRGGSWTLTSR